MKVQDYGKPRLSDLIKMHCYCLFITVEIFALVMYHNYGMLLLL